MTSGGPIAMRGDMQRAEGALDVPLTEAVAGKGMRLTKHAPEVGAPLRKMIRAIFTDILEFRGRVLVIQARQGEATGERRRSRTRFWPVYSCDGAAQFFRRPWVPVSGGRSALDGHAAASIDGQVSQAADRLASTRARRAAAARDVRSPGTPSPVPKYISSGVCPRNAECGSTRTWRRTH